MTPPPRHPHPQGEEPPPPSLRGGGGESHSPGPAPHRRRRYRGMQDGGPGKPTIPGPTARGSAHVGGGTPPRPASSEKLTNEKVTSDPGRRWSLSPRVLRGKGEAGLQLSRWCLLLGVSG
ncbi:cortexin domain containing 2 isoform X1 [Tamandua tetradactyla]|uniref:cortexin domain containing 2 isoform X1 n=1 Tax=Tamandua tetradactyla TaxID=48850 RepID=UPI004053B6B2